MANDQTTPAPAPPPIVSSFTLSPTTELVMQSLAEERDNHSEGSITCSEALVAWQAYLRDVRGLATETTRSYIKGAERIVKDSGAATPADLTPGLLRAWIITSGTVGRAEGTIHKYARDTKRFLKWCIEQGIETSQNAEHVQVATPEYHGTRAFTFDELVALLHRAREVDRVFTTADRFRFYCCLMFTGLRGAEAFGLEWRDIDTAGNRISIRKEIAKSRKRAELYLPKLLVEALGRRGGPNDPVFPKHTNRDTLRRDCSTVGIVRSRPRELGFHSFRKGLLHLMQKEMVDQVMIDKALQDQSRHESTRILNEVYLPVVSPITIAAIDRIEARLVEALGEYKPAKQPRGEFTSTIEIVGPRVA